MGVVVTVVVVLVLTDCGPGIPSFLLRRRLRAGRARVLQVVLKLLLLLVVIVLQGLLPQITTATALVVAVLLLDHRRPVRITANLRPDNRLLVLLLLLLLLGNVVLIRQRGRLLVVRRWDLPVVLQAGPDQRGTVVGHGEAHRVERVLLLMMLLVHRWWMAFFQTHTLRIFAAVRYPPEHEFDRKVVRVLLVVLVLVSVVDFRFAKR